MTARIRRLVDDRTLMLAAVSHDLKTMLTRLRLRAEFIEDGEQKEKAAADLDEMQAMLEATLAFARDDAADERPVAVDLAAMLQSLTADLADAGRDASYDGPDRLTRAGAGRLRSAACSKTCWTMRCATAGRRRVSLQAGATGRRRCGSRTAAPVSPEALRERVFDPFFRVEASRSRDTGGSGLGLAVVRAIVQRHGGEIALEDRPGGGLRARVALPL